MSKENHYLKYFGKKINNLTMISEPYTKLERCKDKASFAIFRCDCGKEREIRCHSVTSENTTSCGTKCPLRKERNRSPENLNNIPEDKWKVKPGEKYNDLKVISPPFRKLKKDGTISAQWVRCKCEECDTEVEVLCHRLIIGRNKSCGCLRNRKKSDCELAKDGKKRCGWCQETKSLSEFNVRNKSRDNYCNLCKNCTRDKKLRQEYGITLEEYNKILEQQGGACACCGSKTNRMPLRCNYKTTDKTFCVDHDHFTKEVRGLLCYMCNLAIGALGDNLDAVTKACNYLRRHHNLPEIPLEELTGHIQA